MSKKAETIPIFFTIDDGFAPYLSVAIRSLVCNASPDRHYDIIVIHRGVSDENRRKLAALVDSDAERFTIRFIPMDDRLDWMSDRLGNRLRADIFTLTIYFRLFIPVMFPEYDKGIYLDSDTVVVGDISELYDTELGENLVGAVVDHSILDIPPFVKYVEQAIGIDRCKYVNSGIQLMNMKKLREVQSDKRFLELMNTYHFDCIAPDQDYLNAMCYGKIKHLPEYWDAMPAEGKEPMQNPQIVHYNLFAKPWCCDNVPYGEYFWQYAEESGFYAEIAEAKARYGEAEKQSDAACLQLMLRRAEEIAATDATFRAVFASGKERRL